MEVFGIMGIFGSSKYHNIVRESRPGGNFKLIAKEPEKTVRYIDHETLAAFGEDGLLDGLKETFRARGYSSPALEPDKFHGQVLEIEEKTGPGEQGGWKKVRIFHNEHFTMLRFTRSDGKGETSYGIAQYGSTYSGDGGVRDDFLQDILQSHQSQFHQEVKKLDVKHHRAQAMKEILVQ